MSHRKPADAGPLNGGGSGSTEGEGKEGQQGCAGLAIKIQSLRKIPLPALPSLHFLEGLRLSLHVSFSSQQDLKEPTKVINQVLCWGCLFPVDKYCANVHFN
jgi:hypothetical protein